MGIQTDEGQAKRDQIMGYMRVFYGEHKYEPTLAQIAEATQMLRTNVEWHLEKLREKGLVTYEDGNRARSLRLR